MRYCSTIPYYGRCKQHTCRTLQTQPLIKKFAKVRALLDLFSPRVPQTLDSFSFPLCSTDLDRGERHSNLQLCEDFIKKSENLGSTPASYAKVNSTGISSRRLRYCDLPQVARFLSVWEFKNLSPPILPQKICKLGNYTNKTR